MITKIATRSEMIRWLLNNARDNHMEAWAEEWLRYAYNADELREIVTEIQREEEIA